MTSGKCMPTNHRSQAVPLVVAVFLLLSSCHHVILSSCHAYEDVLDSPMYRKPYLPIPPVEIIFPDGAKALWLRALERPEVELRSKAADAVTIARRRGVPGLERMAEPLRAALDQPDQHPAVRLAAARALIALDAKQAAASLWQQAQAGGSDSRDAIEPALARWNYEPARAVWLERLRDPATAHRDLVVAIRALAVVREEKATDRLRELALSGREPGPVRLEAARALATLRHDGLEKDAEDLAADASPRGIVPRLAAATLLQEHRGERTVRLLQRLARDPEPTVVALAAGRLLKIDPGLLVPALKDLLANPDAVVRGLAVEVLRLRPSAEHVVLLGDRLDDPHQDVRVSARKALHELAGRKELHERVIAEATRLLAAESWRGQEQAAIVLAQLDHKPAAPRLLELLKSPRPEVYVTAAWGLRKLDVPETLPGALSHVEAVAQGSPAAPRRERSLAHVLGTDHELSQLNQFLGQRKYTPADATLKRFVPKGMGQGGESRAAAIWALGMIHEGKTDTPLAKDLEVRLNDTSSAPQEDIRVRYMSAITLGRMKARDTLPSLRRYCFVKEPSEDHVNNACGWSVELITGETVMGPMRPTRRGQQDWFLAPAEP
jgi:HEAT repeat protein